MMKRHVLLSHTYAGGGLDSRLQEESYSIAKFAIQFGQWGTLAQKTRYIIRARLDGPARPRDLQIFSIALRALKCGKA